MIYKYGIDFGTTNSSIAMRFVGDDDVEHTIVVDLQDIAPRETIPSVVFIDTKNNKDKVCAGAEAIEQYVQNGGKQNEQRFIKQIKLDLEKMGENFSYKVGNGTFAGEHLIAQILKVLRLKAERVADELEIDMAGVVMGVPVQYGDIQKNVLCRALARAGFYRDEREATAKTEFVSEPIAVAVHYGLGAEQNRKIMVFDFGGGTLDVAIVDLQKQDGSKKITPHEVLSKERITLGGEELTRLFFVNSFCANNKYGTQRLAKALGVKKNASPQDIWQRLLQTEVGIKFIAAIEKCKCDLSKALKYKFSFMNRNVLLDEVTFYREDFSNAIASKLADIDKLIDKCLENAGVDDAYDIDNVILAGGSSMIPAVQDLLTDRFGNTRVSSKLSIQDDVVSQFKRNRAKESEVLTSIVRGLAAIGCRDEALVEDVVDSDYGVWDAK